MPEKIDANYKKDSINNSGNQYPFPQFIFYNKPVCFKICGDGYDDFFEQRLMIMDKQSLPTNIIYFALNSLKVFESLNIKLLKESY